MSDKQFFKSLENSRLNDVKKKELRDYFSPIYYCEIEEHAAGELFPRISRWSFYGRQAKKEAEQYFKERDNVIRIIEKSMVTGTERVYKVRIR